VVEKPIIYLQEGSAEPPLHVIATDFRIKYHPKRINELKLGERNSECNRLLITYLSGIMDNSVGTVHNEEIQGVLHIHTYYYQTTKKAFYMNMK
jgi:hypothetical protein